MNEEKQVSIDKQIRQNYRKNFLAKSALVAVLELFIIICLIGAYFVPITLLLSISFIILPLLIGFIAENISANTGNSSVGRMMFGFRLYYSKTFFGIFRILEAIIKTVLVYLAASSIFSLIFHFAIGMNDPTYNSLFMTLISDRNLENFTQNIQNLLDNSTYIFITNLAEIIAIGLASYMLIHHVLTHSIKVFYNLLGRKPFVAPVVNEIHRNAFPRFRRYFYRDYYSSFWYMIIFYIAFYVGGVLIGLLVLNRNGAQSAVIGLFSASLIGTILLPIFFDTIQIMYSVYVVYYLGSLIQLEERLKTFYGVKNNMSNEEKALINESMKQMDEALKNVKSESKGEQENDSQEKKK